MIQYIQFSCNIVYLYLFRAAEMLFYLPGEVDALQVDQPPKLSKAVRMARNCMDCQEFDRAAFFLNRDADQNNLTTFLRFYARYLVGYLCFIAQILFIIDDRMYYCCAEQKKFSMLD